MKTVIKVGSSEDFFKSGREIAKLADRGKLSPRKPILSFEDREDMECYVRDDVSEIIEPSNIAKPTK